jgi:hypothetical protein
MVNPPVGFAGNASPQKSFRIRQKQAFVIGS